MPISKIKRKQITITIPEADYAYLEEMIRRTGDSCKTVSGYVRRLMRYYVWSLRAEAEIRKSEAHLREMRADLGE